MKWKGMSSFRLECTAVELTLLHYAGTNGEEEISGSVTVPEVSHECTDGISDYVVSPIQPPLQSSTHSNTTPPVRMVLHPLRLPILPPILARARPHLEIQ